MIRGIVTCVGYDDLLDITLKRNMQHFSECCVITSLDDSGTFDVASKISGVKIFRTDAFTRYGARFNKGLAMEEGLDFFGRSGWMLIWDADVVLPDVMDLSSTESGTLYGASRRIVSDPSRYKNSMKFDSFPLTEETEFAGFFQLFNASDPALSVRPWYDVTFIHAGGGDSFFQTLWPPEKKVRLPIQVLHLGPRDTNWFGRVSLRVDGSKPDGAAESSKLMGYLKASQGWIKLKKAIRIRDRIRVPGFASKFLWFNSNPDTDIKK
jgi:hypothetical protein